MVEDARYETLMRFLFTELSEPTLRAIKAAADKRHQRIYEQVMANPLSPTGTIETVVEDFLNEVGDYLPDDKEPLFESDIHHPDELPY